jgi:guanylate kinase
VLDIDVQGARQIRSVPEALLVFVHPAVGRSARVAV